MLYTQPAYFHSNHAAESLIRIPVTGPVNIFQIQKNNRIFSQKFLTDTLILQNLQSFKQLRVCTRLKKTF